MTWIKTVQASHKIVFLMFLSFGIAGIIEGAFPRAQDVIFLIHVLILAILLVVWCGVHADENEISPPNGAQLLCGLIGLIGVPYYLLRAFGFKTGGYKFLLGLLTMTMNYSFYEAAFFTGSKLF